MDVGGTAFDNHGSPLPDNVLEEAKKSDAILFGAVGGPKWDDLSWDDRPEYAALRTRPPRADPGRLKRARAEVRCRVG